MSIIFHQCKLLLDVTAKLGLNQKAAVIQNNDKFENVVLTHTHAHVQGCVYLVVDGD